MKPIGLRTGVSAAFALGALILSVRISLVSYESTRRTLLAERERTAVWATYYDAPVVNAGIAGPAPGRVRGAPIAGHRLGPVRAAAP